MFGSVFSLGILRDSDRRRQRARRCVLALEGLEERKLLSLSAPASFHFNRDPVAVAVADLTGSGHQDLVVSDDLGQLTVLLGNGDGTFRNAGSLALPSGGEAVLAAGDFNGDGIPDLIQGNGTGVRLSLGNGDGTFRPGVVIPPFTSSGDGGVTSIAVGDFSGDGKLDLIVATALEGDPTSVFELLGNGDGTFQSPLNLRFRASFAVAGDINNDGKLDVVDQVGFGGPVEQRLGNGDGTFQAPVPFAPGLPLTVADVNGDGIPDLVLPTAQGISERLGNGDGTFQAPITVSIPANTPVDAFLAVSDFNNDGQLDVVIRNQPFVGQSHALSVLLNNGDGTFATALAFATGANPLAIAAGAFTNSGLPDTVTVGFDGQAHVLLNNGNGTFRSGPILSAPGVGTSVVVGDFNGDGQSDIAVFRRSLTDSHSRVDVFLGNGDGTFSPAQVFDLGPNTSSTFGKIVAGDSDSDGRLDLAVLFDDNSVRRSFVEVLLGNGDGTFHAAARRQLGEFNDVSGLAVADFNGDGKLDVVVSHQGDAFGSGSIVGLLLGNGDGSFQDPSIIPVAGNPFSVAVGDLNGDGIPDIVTVNIPNPFSPGSVSALLGNGDGTFSAPVTYQVGVDPAAVIVGDFEGDGILDIAVPNSFSNSVSVLRGNGDGTFQTPVDYLVGVDPRSLVAADFNGDGALDLAVANDHSNDISVLFNDGTSSAPLRAARTRRGTVDRGLVSLLEAEPLAAAPVALAPIPTRSAATSVPQTGTPLVRAAVDHLFGAAGTSDEPLDHGLALLTARNTQNRAWTAAPQVGPLGHEEVLPLLAGSPFSNALPATVWLAPNSYSLG
jgi:hypothetical protein